MRVSGLDKNGDWRFGKGKALYLTRSAAIRQNVMTRLRSLKNDWFLDMDHGSPWFEIFGQRGNEGRVRDEVATVVLRTPGVRKIERLDLVANEDRTATIYLKFIDLFDEEFEEEVVLP